MQTIDIEAEEVKEEITEQKRVFTPGNLLFEKAKDEDIMVLYELAVKIKKDPSFNPIPEIPKDLYLAMVNEITSIGPVSKKQIASFIRAVIVQFAEETDLDKEIKKFNDDMVTVLNEGKMELIDMYADHTKKQFEEELKQRAETEEDPKAKEKLLKMSEAYTDSYKFKKQIDILDDDNFINKLSKYKKEVRFKRVCNDFNFLLNKKLTSKINISKLIDVIPSFLPDITVDEIKDYIIATCVSTNDISSDDAIGLLYMFNSVTIPTMISESSKNFKEDEDATNFGYTCLQNMKIFFDKLKKRKEELA